MAETWFDTRTGDVLVGLPAAADRLDEGGPLHVVELKQLLTAEEFPFKPGDFARQKSSEWSRQDSLNLGAWALKIMEVPEQNISPSHRLTRTHLERLNILGLAPGRSHFNKHYRTMGEYREALSIHHGRDNSKFKDWSLADFVNYAGNLATTLGRKPKKDDYRAGYLEGGPNEFLIISRLGGYAELNDMIGYPNVKKWDKDDYVYWGCKVMEANSGARPTQRMIDILSRRDRGPSASLVASRFGGLSNFQSQVIEAYLASLEDKTAKQAELQGVFNSLEVEPVNSEMDTAAAAKYLVAKRCLPDSQADLISVAVANSSGFISRLRKLNPDLTAGSIEQAAVVLGVFDYIWPLDAGLATLKVSQEEMPFTRDGDRRNMFVAV